LVKFSWSCSTWDFRESRVATMDCCSEREGTGIVTDATLILSGFYQSDCQMLEDKALTLGLHPVTTATDGDWTCCLFKK
jgi:hypothetical protein